MKAKELFDAGNLSAAIAQLSQDVRSHPVDPPLRAFLFELLCFAGDYDRAERQLDAIAARDAKMAEGAAIYRELSRQEGIRLEVAGGERLPAFLAEPPAFAALHVAALNRIAEGKPAEARILLEQAAESQSAAAGEADGAAFADFCDADPILGPFLEAFVRGRYVWIPFAQIRRLSISAPKRLRDLLWAPARIETVDEAGGDILLPVLYAGSFLHQDDNVKLGRATDWTDVGGAIVRGRGQRMFFVDDGERPMLELREISFGPPT
jgi:type VI secretion system protein ImpE